jgi:hypothetical protein
MVNFRESVLDYRRRVILQDYATPVCNNNNRASFLWQQMMNLYTIRMHSIFMNTSVVLETPYDDLSPWMSRYVESIMHFHGQLY